jgi:adenylyltransferase/sulfurtransferase
MESFRNRGFALTANRYLMKVSIAEGIQIVLFPDGRVLVQGTSDPDEAMLICRKHLHTAMATRR